MKHYNYTNLKSIEELKCKRKELYKHSLQIEKKLKTSYNDLKNSLSFANLVASIFSNVSVLLAEAEYLKKLFFKIKNLFTDEPESNNRNG